MKICKFTLVGLIVLFSSFTHSQMFVPGQDIEDSTTKSKFGIGRTALVIGIGTYTNLTKLPHSLSEANLVAQMLKESDFSVLKLLDPDKKALTSTIREFGSKLKKTGGVGLVYFVGHLVPYRYGNYILPTSTKLLSYPEIPDAGVSINSVMEQMDYAENESNMIIINSNYDLALPFSSKQLDAGLLSVDGPKGSLIVLSNELSRKNKIPKSEISMFGQAFINHSGKEGVDVEIMFKNVREDLLAKTDGEVSVWQSSSLLTDFYFKRTSLENETDLDKLAAQHWNSIKLSKKTEPFKKFIEEFPDTPYAKAAQFKLNRLYENSIAENVAESKVTLSPKAIDIIQRISKLLPPQTELTISNIQEAGSYLNILETVIDKSNEHYQKLAVEIVEGYKVLAKRVFSDNDKKLAHELITSAITILPDDEELEDLEESYSEDKGWFSF